MKEQILQLINSQPELARLVQSIAADLSQDDDVTEDSIAQLIELFEHILKNPQEYAGLRQEAMRTGILDDEDLPREFNAQAFVAILAALYFVQDQLMEGEQAFAKGGLAAAARKLQSYGRNGDTMLAHINPQEAAMLKAAGGSGSINPHTGLPEFFFKKLGRALKKVVKAVAPILPVVLNFIAPGVGTAIGTALGATGSAASMLGSAAIGGLSSAAGGGDFVKGALGGALGAGAGSALGGAIGDATGMALSDTAKNVIGSSLIGGAQGAISGEGFGQGALQGAIGGYTGSSLSGMAGDVQGGLGAGLRTAGQQFGNALTMGATPQEALANAAISGVTAGLTAPPAPQPRSIYDITPEGGSGLGLKAPSDIAVEGLRAPRINTASVPQMGLGINYGLGQSGTSFKGPENFGVDYSLYGAPASTAASAQPEMGTGIKMSPLTQIADAQIPGAQKATTPGTKGAESKSLGLGTMAQMLPLISLFGSAQTPEEVQQIVETMTPEQREYFTRPMKYWDWKTIDAAAKIEGLSIGSYIARNWDKITAGQYNMPDEETAPKQLARGGALTRLAKGGGSGRDDTIPARLSDGEYVMDAETVALLGDGSTDEGARRLDSMRAKIRQHKGKSMARGKFSANAKSPLAYLKGAA